MKKKQPKGHVRMEVSAKDFLAFVSKVDNLGKEGFWNADQRHSSLSKIRSLKDLWFKMLEESQLSRHPDLDDFFVAEKEIKKEI